MDLQVRWGGVGAKREPYVIPSQPYPPLHAVATKAAVDLQVGADGRTPARMHSNDN